MTSTRRRKVIWLSVAGVLVLVGGFWVAFGPPGVVDLIGYEEVEPGVIEVALPCQSEVEGRFTWSFEGSTWVFVIGSDPQRYAFGGDDCLSSGRIDLGKPLGERRLVDGFDLSTVGPLP
jgi:hypothetical protein